MLISFTQQVRTILDTVRPDRQTLLFSATFKKRVEGLARDAVKNPIRITVGLVGQSNENISQKVGQSHFFCVFVVGLLQCRLCSNTLSLDSRRHHKVLLRTLCASCYCLSVTDGTPAKANCFEFLSRFPVMFCRYPYRLFYWMTRRRSGRGWSHTPLHLLQQGNCWCSSAIARAVRSSAPTLARYGRNFNVCAS